LTVNTIIFVRANMTCWKTQARTLLRSEISSGICAKLRTVAASNNRDHVLQSLLILLARAAYIMVLFFPHIPFVVNHTINVTPPERLQQHPLLFTTNRTDRTSFVWRLTLARPLYPGHNIILLRSEISSGMCKASHCGSKQQWRSCVAHPVRGESHNQRNTTGEVATTS